MDTMDTSMEIDTPLEQIKLSLDVLSQIPLEIKVEILDYIKTPKFLCELSKLNKSWRAATQSDRLWRELYMRDVMWWDTESTLRVELKEGETWKTKYATSYLQGWQFDASFVHKRCSLSNHNFTISLSSGYSYHGVRATRGETTGKHYFEVIVEKSQIPEENTKFDKGSMIYAGVGVANEKMNVENCCSGWTEYNQGIGIYNDGQIYAFGRRYFDARATPHTKINFKTGDRIGFKVDLDEGNLTFFLNGKQVSDPIKGLSGLHYPYIIMANNIKNKVSITTGRKVPQRELGMISYTNGPAVLQQAFLAQIRQLQELGVQNVDLCNDLLTRYNGDIQSVLNEVFE